MTLNVLVIGAGMYVCGRRTNTFGTVLPALHQAKKDGIVDTVGVCATSKASLIDLFNKNSELSKLFNHNSFINCYPKKKEVDHASFLEAIEEGEYDCGIVVVPDHLHHEIGKALIQNGLHILMVKPLTPEVRSAQDLIMAAESKGVYGAVEFHKRYDKINLKIRECIHNKEIGDVLYCWVEYSQRISIPLDYFKGWAAETNIFQYLGVHYVDIIYFLTGFQPTRVLAVGQKNRLIKEGIDTYDSIQAIIEWKNKDASKSFTSTILTNWIDPRCTSSMSDQKITIIGTEGRIESDQKNRGLRLISDSNGIEDINPYFSNLFYDTDGSSMKFSGYGNDSINQFLKDCLSLKEETKTLKDLKGLRPTFTESLLSTAVIEAVNNSLKHGSEWTPVK